MDSNAYRPRHRAMSAGETYDRLVKASRRSRAGLVSRLDERRAQRDAMRPPTHPEAA